MINCVLLFEIHGDHWRRHGNGSVEGYSDLKPNRCSVAMKLPRRTSTLRSKQINLISGEQTACCIVDHFVIRFRYKQKDGHSLTNTKTSIRETWSQTLYESILHLKRNKCIDNRLILKNKIKFHCNCTRE